jgi:N6-adenosine-specific RNA methylase IME4
MEKAKVNSAIASRDPRDITLGGCRLTASGIVFDGAPTFEEWESAGAFLQRCEGAVQFWIGDWLLYGESRPDWGDHYDEAMSRFGVGRDTLLDYRRVAKAIPPPLRNAKLSWWHHRETVPLAESGGSAELLAEAERDKLPVARLRRRVRQERAKLPVLPAPPPSTYDLILADPPWGFDGGLEADHEPSNGRSKTMSLEALQAFPVSTVAAPDCLLAIWASQPRLADAIDVMREWGFNYRSGFVWDRARLSGAGDYCRVRTEHLLIGVKGSPPLPAREARVENLIAAARGEGKRPALFYEMLEQLYPNALRLEVFPLGDVRLGWKAWGNEKMGVA